MIVLLISRTVNLICLKLILKIDIYTEYNHRKE